LSKNNPEELKHSSNEEEKESDNLSDKKPDQHLIIGENPTPKTEANTSNQFMNTMQMTEDDHMEQDDNPFGIDDSYDNQKDLVNSKADDGLKFDDIPL